MKGPSEQVEYPFLAERKQPAGPLAERTMDFGLSVVKLHGKLPRTTVAEVIGRQLLRSATSVGAQYREACRARSNAEFISKLESCMQELEESGYWLELLLRAKVIASSELEPLFRESTEIARMMTASIRTVKSKNSGAASGRKPLSTEH